METLKQEIKSAVMEDYELEYLKDVKTKSSPLASSNYKKLTANFEINVF